MGNVDKNDKQQLTKDHRDREIELHHYPLAQVHASNAALEASGVPKSAVDSACIGNVLSSSAVDTAYIARHVALRCRDV